MLHTMQGWGVRLVGVVVVVVVRSASTVVIGAFVPVYSNVAAASGL
jgi:hypothetical protein